MPIVAKYIRWDGFSHDDWTPVPMTSAAVHEAIERGDVVYWLTFDPRLDARQRRDAVKFYRRPRVVAIRPVEYEQRSLAA